MQALRQFTGSLKRMFPKPQQNGAFKGLTIHSANYFHPPPPHIPGGSSRLA